MLLAFRTRAVRHTLTVSTSRHGSARHHTGTGRHTARRALTSGPKPPSSTSTSSSNNTAGLRQYLSNGTPEILFGAGLLTLLAADQLIQSRQQAQHKSDREAVFKRLQYEVESDTAQEHADGKSLSLEEESSKPCLFKCRVMTIPRLFDGTKSLMGVKVGDVVDVLEERVGPGGTYNLCRFVQVEGDKGESSDSISVGWYPMSCLEKVKP